jgi:hypothetical protein
MSEQAPCRQCTESLELAARLQVSGPGAQGRAYGKTVTL